MNANYYEDKQYRAIDLTQSNFSFQIKRIAGDQSRAEFILVYYSIALIVMPLTSWYYGEYFDERWSSYSGIILSTVLLVYSIISNKADYSNRIAKLQTALGENKALKGELGNGFASCGIDGFTKSYAYKNIQNRYRKMIRSVEPRQDVDFFLTVKQYSKMNGLSCFTGKQIEKNPINPIYGEAGIKDLLGYISEIYPRTNAVIVNDINIFT